jgi:hypothetical protein
MAALKFGLDSPCTQTALCAEFLDPLFLFGEDLLAGRVIGTAAMTLETYQAFSLVAPSPLAQHGPGDAAAPTDEASIASFFIKLDPGEALSRFSVHSDALLRAGAKFIALLETGLAAGGQVGPALPSSPWPGARVAVQRCSALQPGRLHDTSTVALKQRPQHPRIDC